MKRCPACRRVYDRDAKFCQIDGTTLADFDSDPLIGHTIAKRYRLVRRLGSGPLSVVYLAAELATGRSVAVKILVSELQCDDDVLKQCLWDARFATASRPSHIVRVYEIDRTKDGRVFIAMEYVEGETLSDLVQREGGLEPGRALPLASEIARAVAAASRAGVSHRDLKPQNVMVMRPDGRVKVTDFGVAWLRRAATSGALTRLGDGGTKYMAPEQWVGADADDRTDVYGIGAVLYAMLAGPAPSIARTRVVAGSDIRWEAPPPIRTVRPEIPLSLEHFLARAMEREPERRHNGIEAFAEDLFNLTASILETQTTEAGAREAAPSSLRAVPRVGIALASMSAYLGLWRPYVERGQAYGEQWRARWSEYRARWHAERDRRQVWSRAQISGATVAVARVATGATRTVGHGLAAVTHTAAGAATGASRGVATAAGTVAGAMGVTARTVPLAVRSVGHGLADISRAGAGAASGTVMLATGTVAGAAAAAARAASVVSRAGARRVASISGLAMGAAGMVADSIAGTSRTVSLAAIAAGHGLAGVSRAGAGAAMCASRAVVTTGTIALAGAAGVALRGSRATVAIAGATAVEAAAAARAVPVVTRSGARSMAPVARVVAAAAGAVADAVVGAARTVPTVARTAGHGLASISRVGAGAARRASRAVAISVHTIASAAAATAGAMPVVSRAAARRAAQTSGAVAGAAGTAAHGIAGASRAVSNAARVSARDVGGATRTAAGAVAAVVAGASRTIPVAAQAVGRGLAPGSRAIAGTAADMARSVAAIPGMVAGAMAAAASRVASVATRVARHGMTRLSRARMGAALGISRAVTNATGGLADASAAAGRAVPAMSRAGVRGVAALSRPVVGASGTLAVRSHAAARQASALASRRRDEGLRWMRANGRRLSLTSAAALVILGAATWGTVDWRRGDRAESPSFPRNSTARDSESPVEPGAIETESSVLDTTSPRRAGNKISRADTLARPAAPAVPAADDPNRSLPLQAAGEQRDAERAGSSLPVDTRQPPVGPRVAQLSSQQISRIQTQAEQRLRRRGLLRVSAADRWGVTLETASSGEVTLAGVLRDMALYEEAVRLVREVPEVKAVRGTVEVSDVGTVPIVHSDSARIQVEIQQQLRSRGLLRESEADRWGVTVEVNPEGDVMLVGAVRDTEMYSEAVRRAREVARVRQVKQDIKVMERDLQP